MNSRLSVPIVAGLVLSVCSIQTFSAADALLFTSPPRRAPFYDQRLASNQAVSTSSDISVRYKATKDDTETWSKASGKRDTRLGVRRRVKAVLAKARQRTGVTNDSESRNLLTSDSSLGLEATSSARPGWSISGVNNNDAEDLLGSDASLSLMGGDLEAESLASYQQHNDNKRNGNNEPKKNGNTAPVTAQTESIRAGGQDSPKRNNSAAAPASQPNEDQLKRISKVALPPQQAYQPLPFTLPQLSPQQKQQLSSGERVQEQSKMGGEGSGFVVFDVPAPAYAIWEVLLDFEAYPENIGTVRSMRMFTNTHLKQSYIAETEVEPSAAVRHYGKASISRASFILSKFHLNIAAIHRYQPHPDGHYMVFTLDKACKNVVLKDAKGIWYTESNPEGKEGFTRVWLLCELKVSSLLPKFIVDYAARRAMPRATTWLPGCVQKFLETNNQNKGG